ncbi:hypothetical protein CK203_063709 [Vitis vinifera]|uniref:Mitochondrial protein n=1 Tax=Vitis vinifera TaxID=29760 RepID=A0A438G8J2_VITVI|nr:hypothetical protein CK203_063709 [Vitis vinifera]
MKTLYMMVNSSGHEHIELNKEEIEKPKNLLGTIESPSSWVINLGTTDHMTHSLQKFSTYSPCPSNKKIVTVDGSLATMASQGSKSQNRPLPMRSGNKPRGQALEKNGTWDVVELPREKSQIGCKWVFTIKYKAGGSLERYKAKLVNIWSRLS